MRVIHLLLLGGLLLIVAAAPSFGEWKSRMPAGGTDKQHHPTPPLAESRQLVLVITPDWDAVDGKLWHYERGSTKEDWLQSGGSIPIVVGKKGMAWGAGLHETQPGNGPIKKEGDGKAPAGIFRLSSAFGYTAPGEAGLIKLPYTHLTGTIECVDDVKSEHYNTILDRKIVVAPDWKSSEQMRRQDELYRWGVVVDHNAAPITRGGGSCIFLHIWRQAGSGTAGCTAMESARMEELMRWLDPAAKPLLVQLPEAEYKRLRAPWQLPRRDQENPSLTR
ncbi:MAG TPA: L,D-transpeptidase family protein [Blastocatellia bacterium]|nr:L,D-transpeptidase family protein [Blastocatellia bacterium]